MSSLAHSKAAVNQRYDSSVKRQQETRGMCWDSRAAAYYSRT